MNPLVVFLVGVLVLWALNQFVKEWLIAKLHRDAYDQRVRQVVFDPNAKPKGRFE
ncbi:hypothetical protein HY492_02035 [Candidatus Woesearchaeota archaeon]|nr:hypothetical protein [Candidatus Woesearchaeota archaeon]